MHAFPLGTAEQVKEQLSTLYPEIRWKYADGSWFGSGPNRVTDPYLDLLLREESTQKCFFVILNKVPPSVMRNIMETMHLNYVCTPESGDLVDPYAYDDTDSCFAKRAWSK